jgi:hypothetical protein
MCPTYRIFLNIEKKGRKNLSELSQIRLIESDYVIIYRFRDKNL